MWGKVKNRQKTLYISTLLLADNLSLVLLHLSKGGRMRLFQPQTAAI